MVETPYTSDAAYYAEQDAALAREQRLRALAAAMSQGDLAAITLGARHTDPSIIDISARADGGSNG
jgi:hypothetical protein